MGIGGWIAAACCWLSVILSGARWLRVAQREHYLAGSASRFALRWWVWVPSNLPVLAGALVALVAAWPFPVAAVVTAGAGIVGPLGLSVRGRTSPLHWTRRLRTLAGLWFAFEAAVVGVGLGVGRSPFFAAAAVVVCPLLVDLACFITAPIERRMASRFVSKAAATLSSVNPRIVAITGSYGKTSTKNYVDHFLRSRFGVVATPASFNNRAGLARAFNENLVVGTEVFVAEMGTYKKGEIAELCGWCPPDIAVITAIGPVHLERFGSEDAIMEAKSEITAGAKTVILNIDDARLARFGDQLSVRAEAPRVIRCSSIDLSGDVRVVVESDTCQVLIQGQSIVEQCPIGPGVQATNVACALAVGMHLGVPPEELVRQIEDLPPVPHRLSLGTAPSGVVVIDDTFNSNPAGSRAALRTLSKVASGARRVVVTPGMVELGRRQQAENEAFATASLAAATDLVIVGHTNRTALRSAGSNGRVITVKTREEGVQWVREHLVAGDAVLYENDLPDHYP